MPKTVHLRSWLAALGLALVGCDGGAVVCPDELDCEHTAEVGYSRSISGPYDLSLDLADPVTVRCNDPDSLEAANNPEHVTCGPSGFEIVGDVANQSTIRVTIVDLETEEALALNELVQLTVPPDQIPDDSDCPRCFDRDGNLSLP